jgi:hypothetical protein
LHCSPPPLLEDELLELEELLLDDDEVELEELLLDDEELELDEELLLELDELELDELLLDEDEPSPSPLRVTTGIAGLPGAAWNPNETLPPAGTELFHPE